MKKFKVSFNNCGVRYTGVNSCKVIFADNAKDAALYCADLYSIGDRFFVIVSVEELENSAD